MKPSKIVVLHSGRFVYARIVVDSPATALRGVVNGWEVNGWEYRVVNPLAPTLEGGIAWFEDEGTVWARGWDEETLEALRATHALLENTEFVGAK